MIAYFTSYVHENGVTTMYAKTEFNSEYFLGIIKEEGVEAAIRKITELYNYERAKSFIEGIQRIVITE